MQYMLLFILFASSLAMSMLPYYRNEIQIRITCSMNGFGEPQIIPIDVGVFRQIRQDPLTVEREGSVTLVRSKGRNVLFDLGNIAQLPEVHRGLALSNCGQIDMVVYSHGHTDHFENRLVVPNAPGMLGNYTIEGDIYTATALLKGGRYFLFDDPNLEVIRTPGHTIDRDLSLIVRNVPGKGIVVLTGDLFYFEKDDNTFEQFSEDVDKQKENRRKVACLADYIVPGHGPMFQVTASMKMQAGCSIEPGFSFDRPRFSNRPSKSSNANIWI